MQANGLNKKNEKKHSAGESKDQRRKDHNEEVSSNDNISMRRNKEGKEKEKQLLAKAKVEQL